MGVTQADVIWYHICSIRPRRFLSFADCASKRAQLVEICRRIQNSLLLRRLVTSM